MSYCCVPPLLGWSEKKTTQKKTSRPTVTSARSRGCWAFGGGWAGMSTSKGRMNADSIKACSGQFDLESVYKLVMQRMELRSIEALGPCANLEVCEHGREGRQCGDRQPAMVTPCGRRLSPPCLAEAWLSRNKLLGVLIHATPSPLLGFVLRCWTCPTTG